MRTPEVIAVMLGARPVVITVLFLFLPVRTFAGALEAPDVPHMTIPLAEVAPTIDGEIKPGEWLLASGPAAFMDLQRQNVALEQPQVWLLWDAEALYLAARLPLPKGRQPVATATTRDGRVWEDDAVELFLDPQHTHGDYYQFIANSGGVQWDSRGREPSWHAEWVSKATVAAGHWDLELRVPFGSLGLLAPRPGEVWGLNIAWDRRTPSPLIASWGHVKSGLHEPNNFGHVCFAERAPAVQVTGPLRPAGGKVIFSGTWWSAAPGTAKLQVWRREGTELQALGAKEEARQPLKAPRGLRLEVALPRDQKLVAVGEYPLEFNITEMGRVVYRAVATFKASEPLEAALRRYFLAGSVEVDVDAGGLGRPPSEVIVVVGLLDSKGRRLHSRRLTSLNEDLKGTAILDVRNLRPGEYQVAVVAGTSRGAALKRISLPLTVPAPPPWLGSRAGISEEVLPPWTPVALEGATVRVWGRDYTFGALPFPTGVTTAQASILARPITLRVVVDGVEQEWQPLAEPKALSAQPNRVRLATAAGVEGVRCDGEVSVEYDGMIRSDLKLTPIQGAEITELSLDMALKAEHARYLYHYPGRWGSAYNAGALPAEGFTAGFRPFIWLGDEDRGFAWFCESDQGFAVDDPGQVTQINRENGVVLVRINLIRGTQPVTTPLQYTFGFQATPVKPLTPDVWDYRICHHGSYGIEDQPWQPPASITYPAEGNIRLEQGTFEAWVRPHFNPQPDIAPDDPGRGALNRGLFEIDFHGDDHIGFYWNIDDRGMRVYYKQGTQYPLVMGARSQWQVGEWHHVAFTWGEKTRLYVDGELVAEREYVGTLPRELGAAQIVLGTGPGGPCEFSIDEVRISDIPRESFDLTGPPVADEHTLLLDHLDNPAAVLGDRQTTPERGAAGVTAYGSLVPGKFGMAFDATGGGEKRTLLDRLAELGVRTICFHEHWTDIQNYTSTTHGEALRKLVTACHERGIKLVLYFGYEMSDIAPEWPLYSDECLVWPRAGGYHRLPEQHAYIVCYRSKWQDFMADGIARMMDEYDIDGVYLDGTANPWGCANLHHGCGYRKPDGTVGTTYTFFATREMMRRIYTIVKSRKPDGIVNVHQSTCMTIPTLAFATSYWDGEQFGGIERGPHALEVLPLDAFRCEFMGRQWGIPAEFLCYNRPYTMSEALAFSLLHDVLVRGSLGGSLEMESKLWKGMEAFGRSRAVFLPYWNNADYVTLGPDDSIKATIYSYGVEGAVVVVSNLGKSEQLVQVSLDREGLALPDELQAVDMITDEPVPVSPPAKMSFPLKALGFRVVWVKRSE